MRVYPITQDDTKALSTFSQRMDHIMERFCTTTDQDEPLFAPTDQWGHQDLPEYLPWMGPRYQFAGYEVPKSVFRGEGIALFLLMRMLRPEIAAECFTGTGYASAWMAAGSPASLVYTVDNYSEGNLGYEGRIRASRLHHDLGLSNTVLLQGTVEDLSAQLQGRPLGVYFSDGPPVTPIDLAHDVVVVRHDNLDGQDKKRSFGIRGSSNMTVMCPSVDERNELMSIIARYVPVECCDV